MSLRIFFNGTMSVGHNVEDNFWSRINIQPLIGSTLNKFKFILTLIIFGRGGGVVEPCDAIISEK